MMPRDKGEHTSLQDRERSYRDILKVNLQPFKPENTKCPTELNEPPQTERNQQKEPHRNRSTNSDEFTFSAKRN